MDPNACLMQLLDAIEDRNWNQAEELANALLDWLNKSGFPPKTLGSVRLGTFWHRTVAQFICQAAIARVRNARKRMRRKREA